jgi:hypothetical protein
MNDINTATPGESDNHRALRDGVRAVVSRFGDDYWLERDDDGVFPFGSASRCRRSLAGADAADVSPAQQFVNEILAGGGQAVANGDNVASWKG